MSILSSPYFSVTLLVILALVMVSIFWKRLRVNLKLFWQRQVLRRFRILLLRLFNWLLKLIVYSASGLQSLENWMTSKKKLPKTGMRDLSPTLMADKDRGYSKALKWALENKSIKNLAISGPYGSGKSSIIKVFQRRHPEYHYLNVSLASFKDTKKPKVELVLLSILQQIFYYVKSKSMPESRYKRINPISKTGLLFKSIALVLWAITLCYLSKPEWFKFNKDEQQFLDNHEWIRYYVIGVAIGGAMAILFYFFKLYNNFQLNKLNIASGQLEVQPKSETSILNKYLDEILYFFEISKYDVVIIEDLDRFNLESTEVFTKLRELNTLINNAQQIGRHVVFVYAIREELFKKEDRTKFFDFILPVIPVINSSNSGDQLSMQLAEAGFSEKIDANFVSKLSDYIIDMRILINIMNEFLVYKNTIGDFDFEANNLLGMIVYKNIEPDDFAELQKDKGILFDFINERQDYNEPLIKTLNEQYKKLNQEISAIEETAIANLQELRALYLFALFNRLPTNATGQLDVGNGQVTLKELNTEENFDLVRTAKSITYQYSDYYVQSKSIRYAFSEVEEEVGNPQSYELREKLIRVKAENLVDGKKRELERVQEQINSIRFAKIKELSKISPLGTINPKVQDKKLLVYLLEQGYIDEHYRNYISYFYGASMTSADRDFIMGVNYNRKMDISYKLGKVHEVAKKLSPDDFSKPQAINIELMDFLLADMDSFADPLKRIITQVSSNSTFAKDVREKYRKDGRQKGNFTFQLTKLWPKFWEYIQLESKYSAELQHKYLEDMLNFASLDDLTVQNQSNLLSTYIAQMEDFQEFSKKLTNQAQIDKALVQLNVKFEKLATNDDSHLFNHLLKHNLYQINPHMIELLIRFSAGKRSKSLEGMNTSQYTFLKQFGDEKILSYVEENMNRYVSDVLLKLEGNTEESESTVIGLLNNSEVERKEKMEFLSKQTLRLQALYRIEDKELWTEIIQHDKIMPTWHNVTVYYQHVERVDQVIADYINLEHNVDVLGNILVVDDTDIPKEEISNFFEELLTSGQLTDTTIGHLINSIKPHSFTEINLIGISAARVDNLIRNGFIERTKKNYELLKTSHNGKNIEFLEAEEGVWPDWGSQLIFDANDYLLLFKSSVSSLEDKFVIADGMPLEILDESNEVADVLGKIYASEYLQVPDELFNAVLSNVTTPELKVQMVLKHQSEFSTDRLKKLLPLMGETYGAILTEPKVAKLPNTIYNRGLSEFLAGMGVISSLSGKDEDTLRLNMFQKDR